MKAIIARLPSEITGSQAIEVLFRTEDDGTASVDVRFRGEVWTPIELYGGSIEIRER